MPQIDWVRIATEIELNYTFDAFVILHGTDTMAYTSSALSFLLEDLGKTVVTALSLSLFSPLLIFHKDIDRCTDTPLSTEK